MQIYHVFCSEANYLKVQVLTGIVPAAADQRGFLPVWGVKKAQDVNYDLQQGDRNTALEVCWSWKRKIHRRVTWQPFINSNDSILYDWITFCPLTRAVCHDIVALMVPPETQQFNLSSVEDMTLRPLCQTTCMQFIWILMYCEKHTLDFPVM